MPFDRAWFYSRKSRALGDPDDPKLLEYHLKEMARKAEEDDQPLPPERIVFEIGSGEYIAERPRFAALLKEWEQLPLGCGGIIYTPEVARLSRGSQTEWGRIEEALRRACLRIRTRRRTFDLNDPDDSNWLEWEILYSRFELRMNKIRMAAWRAGQLRAGKIRTGRVPSLGYGRDPKTGQPAPNERFPLLQQLCREALTTSVNELARRHHLAQSTLLWTLSNPLICGWPAQRYRSYIPEKGWRRPGWRLPRDQWLWPDKPGDYPPACSRAQWEAIQAAIERRQYQRERCGSDAGYCRDVVTFVGHAGRVHLGAVRPPQGEQYFSYDLQPASGPRLYIRRELVHERATTALRSVFTQPTWLKAALDQYERQSAERQATAALDSAQLRRSLERERGRLVGLAKALYDPEASPEALTAARTAQADTEKLIERINADLDRAAAAPPLEVDLAEVWDDLPLLCQEWDALWADDALMPDARRRRIVRICLASVPVVVDPERSRRPVYRAVGEPEYAAWLRDALVE
jgi:hypothetical protein